VLSEPFSAGLRSGGVDGRRQTLEGAPMFGCLFSLVLEAVSCVATVSSLGALAEFFAQGGGVWWYDRECELPYERAGRDIREYFECLPEL